MSVPILATKLYIPQRRPQAVPRPRLVKQLNDGRHRKLTLISAPAGFGKTTLVSEWLAQAEGSAAWLSLDESDNDLTRFLTYLVAALQTISIPISKRVTGALQSAQPIPMDAVLSTLVNDIAAFPDKFILVLDDYHLIDARVIDNALTFFLDHLPRSMHLVIATREDPQFPLTRLRARDQLTEIRITDLRFTLAEAAGFLNQALGFSLSEEAIASLEARTEGWIAGLQLAAVSMKQHQDTASFIRSFTGAHHYVMDYLMEEVLHQQPENIQTFLLHTSILNRMCGSLCDAILDSSPGSGQEKLEVLEHTNLFIVPLDNERRWYRYHHLFAELLRQRLFQKVSSSLVNELHERASLWYEANGLELEAFHRAAASNHIDHATRLMAGGGMPLHFRGAVVPVLNWLASLPVQALDERPALWVMYASASSMAGQHSQVEPKLQAAEAVLKDAELTPTHKNLIGHIAAIRAMMAAEQNQAETIISQSHRALEYLSPNNVPVRTATVWKLGYAYQLQGNRSAAQQAYTEVLASSQASGNVMFQILALTALARLQESAAQLLLAAENYQRALQLLDEMPSPIICEAHLGLARINYEWNKLDSAQQHAQSSVHLARQIENSDRFISGELFLARLRLAQNNLTGAAVILANAEQFIHQHQFLYRIPELAAIRVRLLLQQGRLLAAAELAQTHSLPISQARVLIAQGNLSAALTLLEQELNQVSAKGWEDERLQIMVLQTVAFMLDGKKGTALQVLDEALVMAAPGRFIRRFVDEGLPMMQVLSKAAVRQIMPDYTGRLLAEMQHLKTGTSAATDQLLIEPLSERELEILQLIAQGFSNLEIGERLFLALDTVKGHNRRIYGKLQVQRRTEAVARARDLGLL